MLWALEPLNQVFFWGLYVILCYIDVRFITSWAYEWDWDIPIELYIIGSSYHISWREPSYTNFGFFEKESIKKKKKYIGKENEV